MNPDTFDPNFQIPAPERIGEERGSLTRIIQELVFTVDFVVINGINIG